MSDTALASGAAPSRARVLTAYAIIYVVWGSTYLGINIALESLPPFLLAAARFTTAGALLYIWMRARGAARPSLNQWKGAAIVGGLLLFAGNGGVVWAQQYVPSGVAALLVATLPLWMALLEWVGPDRRRPTAQVGLGLAVGLVGIVVLVGPGALTGQGNVSLVGAGALILASFAWAVGSLYARRAPVPATPQLGTAMQMLSGGLMLIVGGVLSGEASAIHLDAIATRSAVALVYLIVFGSLIAFSAYVWLLRVEPPSRVATYAYVNPVVAVTLGWLFAGETLTPQTMIAAAIIIGAVVLIVSARKTPASRGGAHTPPPSATTPRRRRRKPVNA